MRTRAKPKTVKVTAKPRSVRSDALAEQFGATFRAARGRMELVSADGVAPRLEAFYAAHRLRVLVGLMPHGDVNLMGEWVSFFALHGDSVRLFINMKDGSWRVLPSVRASRTNSQPIERGSGLLELLRWLRVNRIVQADEALALLGAAALDLVQPQGEP